MIAAVAGSFIGLAIKVVFFAVIAYVGIIGGKKFRDKRDADKVNLIKTAIKQADGTEE